MRNKTLQETFNFPFSRDFACINKIFILAATLSSRLLLSEVLRLSWYYLISWDAKFYVIWQLVRQLEYTMFISNDLGRFYLRFKENLAKHLKVSTYYGNCYQVRRMLAYFWNLSLLILGYNCVKCLRVTKIVDKIKFEKVWGDWEARIFFQRQALTKY